jgi:hypothetical protein
MCLDPTVGRLRESRESTATWGGWRGGRWLRRRIRLRTHLPSILADRSSDVRKR